MCVADYHAERANETVEAIRADGGVAHALMADLTELQAAKQLSHHAAEIMGGLDHLCATAGMPSPHGLEGIDFEEVERCMNLNVMSTMGTVGEAIGYLREGIAPAIVLTSSISGLVGSRLSPVYSVAKFGVVGLAKSLAQTLGPDGIRVNALCPGIADRLR